MREHRVESVNSTQALHNVKSTTFNFKENVVRPNVFPFLEVCNIEQKSHLTW